MSIPPTPEEHIRQRREVETEPYVPVGDQTISGGIKFVAGIVGIIVAVIVVWIIVGVVYEHRAAIATAVTYSVVVLVGITAIALWIVVNIDTLDTARRTSGVFPEGSPFPQPSPRRKTRAPQPRPRDPSPPVRPTGDISDVRKDLSTRDWRAMRDIAFEYFLKEVFEANGYEVEQTERTGDQGVDLIAKKYKRRIAIQVKGAKDNVGNSAVREVYAGNAHYGCDVAVVITNSGFTRHAIEHAEKLRVILVDGSQINRLILNEIEFVSSR